MNIVTVYVTAVGIKYNLFYGNCELEFVPVLKTFTKDQNMVRLITRYIQYTYIPTYNKIESTSSSASQLF